MAAAASARAAWNQWMLDADVVRGDVEDQPDVARRGCRPKRGQALVAAEVRGHVVVVDDVIAVIGPRVEDRA